MSQPVCDGCGLPANEEHVSRRLQRLELATRFRPIHISILFLAEAPPALLQNHFYFPVRERDERTGLSRILFDALMLGVGITQAERFDSAHREGKGDEECLAEFQRGGYFLADCLECPVEEVVPGVREGTVRANAFELAHRYGPTIVRRVQQSYKPQHIVLLSTRTRHVIPFFQRAGLGDRLLLYQGLPLHFPHPHNPAAQAQFRSGLAEILSRASAKSAKS